MGLPVLWFLARGQILAAACCYVAGALTDALDGWAARKWSGPTRLGRLLDALGDRAFVLFTAAGLHLAGQLQPLAQLTLGLSTLR